MTYTQNWSPPHSDTHAAHLFPPHPVLAHCNRSLPQGVPPPIPAAPFSFPQSPCPTLPVFAPSISCPSQSPPFVPGSSCDDQVSASVPTQSIVQGVPGAGMFRNFHTQGLAQGKRKAEDLTPEVRQTPAIDPN